MKSQKVTQTVSEPRRAEHGRWYADGCGAAFALEILGERWAMLIVRELMLGPRRFSQLRASLPKISARVLTERLESLERHQVVARQEIDEPVPARFYALTEWGRAAEPAILALCRWGLSARAHDPAIGVSPVAAVLSLKANYTGANGGDPITVGLEIGDARFVARLGETMEVERGDPAEAQIVLSAEQPLPILAAFYRKTGLSNLAGSLHARGDIAAAQAAIARFAFPERLTP
ncbi:winged helix-turn-helix transcriptional regulator [Tsuneonella suprasediminis]|uniref:winged helix-turn-helix transcriptional regulator n=1 Tax=Tsuneonella suprasediminis TaxID=2306996 RepID=UPI00196ACD94|nr:helix-turn-helix domain-containing protein [Tsuneonella suprasediminis]